MAIYKYLDSSTGHLTASDAKALAANLPDFTTFAKYEYGYFIGVPQNPSFLFPEIRNTWGLSQAFCKLLHYAWEQGCLVIRLDCDADPIDELQTFEW